MNDIWHLYVYYKYNIRCKPWKLGNVFHWFTHNICCKPEDNAHSCAHVTVSILKSSEITQKSGCRCACLTCIIWIRSLVLLASIVSLVPQKYLTNYFREISLTQQGWLTNKQGKIKPFREVLKKLFFLGIIPKPVDPPPSRYF